MSDMAKLRTTLTDYPFPETVIAQVAPLAALVEAGDIDQARRALGRLALKIFKALRSNSIAPREADQVFTLIDVFLSDNFSTVNMGDTADELIFEGQLMHHYGDASGPDMKLMERLAGELIGEN